MDYETYDDDRPTDRADELEHGDEAVAHDAFGHESIFEAPDLATAFLAALDAVDDRAYVAPPLDPDPETAPPAPPALATAPSEPEPAHVIESAPEPSALPETPAPVAPSLIASATPLEPGTLALDSSDSNDSNNNYSFESSSTLYGMPSPFANYVVEHDDPVPTPAPASGTPSDAAVAEAFAREQAALELWGSDAPDTSDQDDSAAEAAALASAEEETAAAEAAAEAAAIEAAIRAEIQAEADTSPSQTDLVLETVSNQDSYYDPDTLRLARPLFSPDEPRAFAGPVYVGDAAAAEGEAEAHAAAAADIEAEPEVLEDLEEFVAFSLGETRCVVPIRNVIEIGRIPDAVGVPNAPAWLHGLGNLRGQVLSLIDLRAFLGIGRVRPATGRMLVLRTDDDEVQAGLLVDHVHQIVSLSASRFHEVPETLPQHYARHAWGVCDYGNYTMIGLEVDDLLGLESMAAEEAEAL